MKFPYEQHEVDPSAFPPSGVLYHPEVMFRVSGPAGDVFLLSSQETVPGTNGTYPLTPFLPAFDSLVSPLYAG